MEGSSVIERTQSDLFEPSEPQTDSESDTDSAQPHSSQSITLHTNVKPQSTSGHVSGAERGASGERSVRNIVGAQSGF